MAKEVFSFVPICHPSIVCSKPLVVHLHILVFIVGVHYCMKLRAIFLWSHFRNVSSQKSHHSYHSLSASSPICLVSSTNIMSTGIHVCQKHLKAKYGLIHFPHTFSTNTGGVGLPNPILFKSSFLSLYPSLSFRIFNISNVGFDSESATVSLCFCHNCFV
jgi:hypothetical protein